MIKIPAIAVFIVILGTVPTLAFECIDYARMGTMLGQINRQCSKFRLTDAGQRVLLDMAAKSLPGGQTCAAEGKTSMLQELSESFPELTRAAASGNKNRFNLVLCQSIATHLNVVSAKNGIPMVEARP